MTNLSEILFDKNKNNLDKIAFVDATSSVTYGELEHKVRCLACWMISKQIGPGDRISIALVDKIDTIIIFLSTVLVGAIAVMHNPKSKNEKLIYQINHVDPTLIFIEANIKNIISHPSMYTSDEALASSKNLIPWYGIANQSIDDVAYMLFTSGTTGNSKAVMLTHNNVITQCKNVVEETLKISSNDKTFCTAKLYFAIGVNFAFHGVMWSGSQAYLDSGLATPSRIRQILSDYKPTLFYSVPVIYSQVAVDNCSMPLTARCYSGGDKLPQTVLDRWYSYTGQKIYNIYGITECVSIVCRNPVGDSGVLSVVSPGYSVRIVDADNNIVNTGTVGRLQIKADSMAKGYYNDTEWTEKMFTEWVSPGDLFYADASNGYHYVGRASDVIKIHGQYINPSELEESLLKFQGIEQAVVIAIPGKDDIDELEAFVVPVKDVQLDLVNIKRWMLGKHDKHSCPRVIRVVDELPRTDTGKLERYKLKNII